MRSRKKTDIHRGMWEAQPHPRRGRLPEVGLEASAENLCVEGGPAGQGTNTLSQEDPACEEQTQGPFQGRRSVQGQDWGQSVRHLRCQTQSLQLSGSRRPGTLLAGGRLPQPLEKTLGSTVVTQLLTQFALKRSKYQAAAHQTSGANGKELACRCRRHKRCGLIPGSGRSPRGGHGHPLQCSCLENPMDRGAWRVTGHGVAENQTGLK